NLSLVTPSIDVGLPGFDWQAPHAIQYNLAFEREARRNTVITLAYAGARGIHLPRTGEVNTPLPQILPTGAFLFSTTAPRRNPAIGSITLTRTDGNSWYNAMELRLVSRLQTNFQINVSYTF